MRSLKRIIVAASGEGSNFQALIDRFSAPGSSVEIAGLLASRPTAGAIDRARGADIPFAVLPEAVGPAESDFLLRAVEAWEGDLIVLAGWMRLIPEKAVRAWQGRVVNLHPALLPAFGGEGMYGQRVHQAVIDSGARVTGATVHFVDESYDRGPIIAQWPVPVLATDGAEDVAARVLEVEHALLPAVVEALAKGAVWLDEQGQVRWSREWFVAERFGVLEAFGAGPFDPDKRWNP